MKKQSPSIQKLGGSLLTYIYMGIGLIVSFVYTPVMLNLMGQSEYGLYTIALSVITYLSVLDFGMNSAYVKFYSGFAHEKDEQGLAGLNSMYLFVFSILGMVACAAGMTLAVNADSVFSSSLTGTEVARLRDALIIVAINAAVSLPLGIFSSYILANEKFIFSRLMLIVRQLLNPLLSLPLLLLGYASVGMMISFLVITIVIGISNALYSTIKLKIRFSFSRMDFRLLKSLFSFSFFIFLNTVVNEINWYVGKLLLGIYRGTADTAVFGLASTVNTHYLAISTAISNVYVPKVNQLVASKSPKETIDRLFLQISRVQIVVVLFVLAVFIAIGRPFILLMWGGEAYEGAYFMACILMISETIPLTQNLGIEIQRAMNKHQFRSVIYAIIALINLAISIPLCIRYGGYGCAIGTAVGQVIGNTIIMNWYYQKKINLDIVSYWKQLGKIIPRLALPLLLCIGFAFINVSTIPTFFAIFVFICVVFVASFYLFVLTDREKMIIKGFASPRKK